MNGANGEAVEFDVDSDASLAAFVFKTTADPFVGKLSLFRVYRGTFKSNSEVWNANRNQNERIGQLYLPRGKSQENISEVVAGDMGAIGKLAATVTGDTLCVRDNQVTFRPIEFPRGYYSVAVAPATKADLDKMSTSLARIVEEDPSLRYSRDADTGDSLLTGLGDAQIEVAIDRIRRKFGADLVLRMPKVAYRETITRTVEIDTTFRRQTGGAGQYARCVLRFETIPEDERADADGELLFADAIRGGAIPKEFIPAVKKGVTQAMQGGVIAGYPVVNIKATVVDGAFHEVDSSEIAFTIAGSMCLKEGIQKGKPVILEPAMQVEVVVPDNYTGAVVGIEVAGHRVDGVDVVTRDLALQQPQFVTGEACRGHTPQIKHDFNQVVGGVEAVEGHLQFRRQDFAQFVDVIRDATFAGDRYASLSKGL